MGVREGDVDSRQGNASVPSHADRQDTDRELCDVKQHILGSADGSNTQPQQETLIVRGLREKDSGSGRRCGVWAARRCCVWPASGPYLVGLSKPSATNLLSRALGAQALPSFGYRRSFLAARGVTCCFLGPGACCTCGMFLMRLEKVPKPAFPDAELVLWWHG